MNSGFIYNKRNHTPESLFNYEPRAGFKQRFWARVEIKPVMPVRLFRWLVFGVALIGIVVGGGIPILTGSRTQSLGEMQQMSGLSLGSLTQSIMSEGKNR